MAQLGVESKAKSVATEMKKKGTVLMWCDPDHFTFIRAIATKNRINYRRLRKELEELTDHGMLMLKSLQRPDANVMQRLAVQVGGNMHATAIMCRRVVNNLHPSYAGTVQATGSGLDLLQQILEDAGPRVRAISGVEHFSGNSASLHLASS